MTTTPEQLQAWREEFALGLKINLRELNPSKNFAAIGIEREFRGYLRAKQETEEAIKDAENLRTVAINLIAAARTLEGLGYTYHDGELWKPPLGKSAEPLLDRITELEAQLADAKQVANDCRIVADNAIAEALTAKKIRGLTC